MTEKLTSNNHHDRGQKESRAQQRKNVRIALP